MSSMPTKTNPHQKVILQSQDTSELTDSKIIKVHINKDNNILLHDYKLHLPCKVLLEKINIGTLHNAPSNKTNYTVKRHIKKSRLRIPTTNTVLQNKAVQEESDMVNVKHYTNNVISNKEHTLPSDHKLNLKCKVMLEDFAVESYKTTRNKIKTIDTFESCDNESNTRNILLRATNTNAARTNTVLQNEAVQEESDMVNVKHYSNNVISNKEHMLPSDHKLNLKCKVMLENFAVKPYKTTRNKIKNIDTLESCDNERNTRNILSRATNPNAKVQNNIASRVQFNTKEKATDLLNEESSIPIDTLVVPTFHGNIVSSTPVKGNKKYCAELLLNNSEILVKAKQNVDKKLPIYRQHIVDNENKTDNLYEFDEIDSGIVKKCRKRRKRIPKRTEVKKPVYDILKNMVKQTVSKVNKKIKSPKKLQTIKMNENYDKIVDQIVQKIIDKSQIRSKISEPVLDVESDKSQIRSKVSKPVLDVSKINIISQNSSMDTVKRKTSIVVSPDKGLNDYTLQEKEIALGDISNENINEDISDTEDNFEPNNSEDKYFGFDSESSGAKINILSDITLNKNLLPKANSTMLSSKKHSPWRFSENVKRNPHYINIKKTALPCIQQDMVIDYNQLEKILEHFSKSTSKIESSRRSPVQKSILDYVTNSSEDNNQENIPRPSLFDYDDFNPRTIKLSDNTSNKSKRNVLGPLQDNILNNSDKSVQRHRINKNKLLDDNDRNIDIITYFGFDNTEEIAAEINTGVVENRPFRIREKIKLKRSAEIVTVEENLPVSPAPSSPKAAPTSPVAAPALSISTSPVETQPASEDVEIKLFEDPEPVVSVTLPLKIYERKRRKRKLVFDDLENNEDVNKKKHKKDVMTKAEEAELEKWAAKFNSACEEIDKHELEIE